MRAGGQTVCGHRGRYVMELVGQGIIKKFPSDGFCSLYEIKRDGYQL